MTKQMQISNEELYTELGKPGRRGAKRILAQRIPCHPNTIRNVLLLGMPSEFEQKMREQAIAMVEAYSLAEIQQRERRLAAIKAAEAAKSARQAELTKARQQAAEAQRKARAASLRFKELAASRM